MGVSRHHDVIAWLAIAAVVATRYRLAVEQDALELRGAA